MLKTTKEKSKKRGGEKDSAVRERLTGVNVIRKERWKRCSMDGHNSRREEERAGGREKQLSSCPSLHASSLGGLRL